MARDKEVDEPQQVRTEPVEHGRLETEPTANVVREEIPEVRQSQTTRVVPPRDSARWGPIWSGLIAALTTFLLLQLLVIGLGLTGIGPDDTGGVWVSAIVGLIAFFTGGSVAGMTSAVRGPATGLLNGFLVWALGTVLIMLLSALGLGQIFGPLGSVIGLFSLIQQGGLNAPNLDPAQLAEAAKTGALTAFFGLAVAALASMLGGWLGGRTDKPIGRIGDMDRA